MVGTRRCRGTGSTPVPVTIGGGNGEAKVEMVPVVSNVRVVTAGSFDETKVLKPDPV